MITNPQGQQCFPFDVHWDSDEGTQTIILWATSEYHATLLLEDLKNSAQIVGFNMTVHAENK